VGHHVTSYRVLAGSRPTACNLADFNTGSAATTNVPPGTYYMRVVAVNAAGTSGRSNEITVGAFARLINLSAIR
jgi:hypothetical protein